MKLRRWLTLGLGAVALLAAGCRAETQAVPNQSPGARVSPAGLQLIPLEIRSGGKVHHFRVEVAATADEQQQGLMFRESLGPNEGMIFPFPTPRPAAFWMKNTLIPLDMLFIRADGSIARIAANTVPHSLQSVQSGEPVQAVLEIRGGRAAELEIQPDDRVIWSMPASR